MSFRYLFALVVILSLFTFGCTTSTQADPEISNQSDPETQQATEIDRKVEAMRIAVQIVDNLPACQSSEVFGIPSGTVKLCLTAVDEAYRFIIERVTSGEQ